MKSDITKILNIMDADAEFISKGFSNGYNFDETNARDYLTELLSNNENSPIFAGIIILQRDYINYSIVDGLQRITTINLLSAALCNKYQNINVDTAERIKQKYLIKDNKPKLQLQGKDNSILHKIIFEKEINEADKNTNLYKTYKCFTEMLDNKICDINKLLMLITQIQFLFVIAKESEMPARELYQSLNDIKKDSQINLISDFMEQQDYSVQKNWKKVIELLENSPAKTEDFFNDFLQSRFENGLINKNILYDNFKKYYEKMIKYQSAKEITDTIKKYAIFYIRILREDFQNPEIKKQVNILNKNSNKKTYPYLMEVLDDLENGHITEKAFLNILLMINSFIANKKDDDNNSIDFDFSKLSKELNKMMIIKDYVPETVSENKLTINEINKMSDFEV